MPRLTGVILYNNDDGTNVALPSPPTFSLFHLSYTGLCALVCARIRTFTHTHTHTHTVIHAVLKHNFNPCCTATPCVLVLFSCDVAASLGNVTRSHPHWLFEATLLLGRKQTDTNCGPATASKNCYFRTVENNFVARARRCHVSDPYVPGSSFRICFYPLSRFFGRPGRPFSRCRRDAIDVRQWSSATSLGWGRGRVDNLPRVDHWSFSRGVKLKGRQRSHNSQHLRSLIGQVFLHTFSNNNYNYNISNNNPPNPKRGRR